MSQDLKSRIWVSQGLKYHFPEQCLKEVKSKPHIGACFSGGGTRAMTAAMGQLRALDHLGVIPTLRYITCVSGGSWASTIYTYYRKGASCDAELLGPITRAKGVTDQHVKNGLTSSQLAFGATKSLEDIVAGWELDPFGNYTSHDVWNYSIGQAYLEHYGLFDSHTATNHPNNLPYFSYDVTTVGEIKQCNSRLIDKDFLTVRAGRPYLIINSCVLLPQSDPNQADLINFEYTPLTVGRPYLTKINNTNYGGGFIEPFAYRGGAPVSAPDPKPCAKSARPLDSAGWVNIPEAKRHYSLTETTGTSSSAFAEELIKNYDTLRFDPQDFYWAVNGMGPYTGAEALFGDGGLLENNGIIPLIQRGIQLAIVFVNTETKLDPTFAPNDNSHDESNDPNGRCDVYIPSLFGYANAKWKWYYPNNKVFPTSEFKMVLDALNAKRAKNEPMIVNCQHTVVDNDSWGVKARKEKVWVTWCYLDRCTEWEANLGSANIRQQINEGNPPAGQKPKGPYENFPNYKTLFQNGDNVVELTKEQITLLADFTCDCILLDEEQTIIQAIKNVN